MEAKILGDYRLIKTLGKGALGTVFLAEHRFMKRNFTLKVLPEELSSDRTFIKRFEEEIGYLAQLDHPHITKVHNISYAEGSYFLVTDCIVDEQGEATNLAKYLKSHQQPASTQERLPLLRQIAEALDYAHQLKGGGIAHRGLKLNNILVSQRGKDVVLQLTDFGLSRIIGAGPLLARTYQMVAEVFGLKGGGQVKRADEQMTPLHESFLQSFYFLAPEQRRFGEQIGPQADRYAFGVLVYHLLTGHYPEGAFPLPSELGIGAEKGWDDLVRMCLHPSPKQRVDSLVPLLDRIEKGEAHDAGSGTMRPVLQTAKLERPEIDPDPAAKLQVDGTVKHYNPEPKEYKEIEPILTEMVVIEGGIFWRGSNEGNRDERPHHKVTVSSFAVDIHPVTNEQFVRFLEAMGGEKDSNHLDLIRLRDSRIKRVAGKVVVESGYLKHPVVGVTWYGATAYAKWVGKRLPTEAEWEVAACGGFENALFPTGEEIEKTQANFFSADTIAVMSYPPNGYGLYDMAGNVYEWCYDWYGYNYYDTSVQEPDNPRGPRQGVYRVLRGGCWKSLQEDLRCSRRHRNNPGTVNSTYGFRCVADAQPS